MLQAKQRDVKFLRYELRRGNIVAVFWLDALVRQFDGDGRAHWTDETVLDRPALESRLLDLEAQGRCCGETRAALLGWPATPRTR